MSDAFDYSESRDDADELIAEFGASAILKRPVAASGPKYDPTPGVPLQRNVTAVEIEWKFGQVDGTSILATDKRFLIAAGSTDLAPTEGDTVTWGGVAYAVIKGQPLAPGGLAVLFDVQCRKS